MKKEISTILFVVIALFITTNARSQNDECLYLYTSNNTLLSSFTFDDLQTITFTEQGMVFNIRNGSPAPVPFDEISTWLFYSKETDIPLPPIKGEVKVYLNNEQVIVECSEEISSVYLYNMQGVLLQELTPNSQSVNLPLSNQPAGLYIIRIVCGQGQISTHKIIKH